VRDEIRGMSSALFVLVWLFLWLPGHVSGAEVKTPADLGLLIQDPSVKDTLGILDRLELLDATGDGFSPFDSTEVHRFRIRGNVRSDAGSPRVDLLAWTVDARLRLGLDRPGVEGTLKVLMDRLSKESKTAVLLAQTPVSLRRTDPSGWVDVNLDVMIEKAGRRFVAPVSFRIEWLRGGWKAQGPGIQDVLSLIDAAMLDVRASYFLTRSRAVGSIKAPPSIPIHRIDAGLALELYYDLPLFQSSAILVGGLFRTDGRSGQTGFLDYCLPLGDLDGVTFPELVRIKDEPMTKWLVSHHTSAGYIHVQNRQGGSVVKIYSGNGNWVAFSVGERVELLSSHIAESPPLRKDGQSQLEIQALRFLEEAQTASDFSSLERLIRSYPENLLLLVSLAEEASRAGQRGKAEELVRRASDSLSQVVIGWEDALRYSARGDVGAALASLRRVVVRCPVDAGIWRAIRVLRLASGDRELGPDWPIPLAVWRSAGYGVYQGPKALVPRLDLLRTGAPNGLAVSSVSTAPLAHGPPAGDRSTGRIPRGYEGEWEIDDRASPAGEILLRAAFGPGNRGVKGGLSNDHETRVVTLRERTPKPGKAQVRIHGLSAEDSSIVREDSSIVRPELPLDPGLVRQVALRLAQLRIGARYLIRPSGRALDVLFVRLDPSLLLASPSIRRLRPLPEGLLGSFGPLLPTTLARALRQPLWVALYALGPGPSDAASGDLVGIQFPDVDQGILLKFIIPPGFLSRSDLRAFLAGQLIQEPLALPAGAALILANSRLSVLGPRSIDRTMERLGAALYRSPLRRVEPTRIFFDRACIVSDGGWVRLASPLN